MAFQPLYGQTANIFGRKSLMVTAIFTFIVGSAIAGASQSMAMLIAGRAIQVSLTQPALSPQLLTITRELEVVE